LAWDVPGNISAEENIGRRDFSGVDLWIEADVEYGDVF